MFAQFKNKGKQSQVWQFTPLIPALRGQKQMDLLGFDASLIYKVSSRTTRTKQKTKFLVCSMLGTSYIPSPTYVIFDIDYLLVCLLVSLTDSPVRSSKKSLNKAMVARVNSALPLW